MGELAGPRACRPDELASLSKLEDTVFRSGNTTSMFDEFPVLFAPENCENIRVLVDGDRVVSTMAYTIRPTIVYGSRVTVASLGAVCTYEEYRGRGLATVLLEDSFAAARSAGADIMLISGTRGLYERGGCALGPMQMFYTMQSDGPRGFGGLEDIAIRETLDDDVDALIELHQHEPVRYARTADDWRGFLHVCRLIHPEYEAPRGQKRSYVISSKGRAVAHLALQYPHEGPEKTVRIVEFSGRRAAALEAARRLAADFGSGDLYGSVQRGDYESLALLDEIGAKVERQLVGGHRLSILNDDIFDRYRVWLAEQVGVDAAMGMAIERSGDEYALRLGDRSFTVGDILTLNSVLFGTGGETINLPGEWKRVLPLPLALPGLNYI